jgi:uncharacterized protein affecting Mg2+/Co2+ transport
LIHIEVQSDKDRERYSWKWTITRALNNKIMLKRLLRSTFESKDIDDFRKTLEEMTAEDPA